MPAKPNNLISTKEAARLVGRSSDYIARLARAEKIVAEKIGGSWLVDRDSLLSFFDVQEKISEEKKEQLSSVRKEEYKNSQAVLPRAQKFIQTEVHHGIFTAHNLIALTASILLVFGGYITVQAQPVQHAFSEIKEKAISGVYVVRRSIESAARAPELVSDLYEVQKTNYVVLDSPLPEIASSFSEVFAGMGFGAGELRARYVADATEITTPVSVTDVATSIFRNYKSVGVVLLDTGRSIQNAHLSLVEWTAQTVVSTAVAAKFSSDFVIDTYVSGVKTFTSVAQSYPENYVAGVYSFVNRTPQVARQVALVPYVVGDALVSAVGELPKAQERFAYGLAENAPKLVGEVAQSSLSFGAGVVDTSETITSSYRSGIEKVGEQIGETYLEARIVFPAYAEQNLRVAAVRAGSEVASALTPLVSEIQQVVANQVVGVIRIGQTVTDIKNEWIAGVVGTKNHVVTQVDGVELQGGVVSAVESFFARFFNQNREPVLLVTSGAKTITQEEAAPQPVRTSPVTNNFYSFQDTGITRSYVDANLAALRSYILAEIDSLDFVVERSDSDNYSNILDTLNDAVTGELAPSSIRTTGDITAGSFTGGTASFATTTITELTVTGDTTFSGTLTVGGLATTGALTAPYFNATSTTATSSFAGGFNVGSGAFVYDRNSGNVGVGTTSPFTDFAVSGDSYVSGDLTSAGTVTGTSGLFTGLIATNATATNATSTNFYTDIFRAATGVITTLTGTNLSFTNATTTNATSTNLAIESLTANRVPFATTGGRLIDSANFTFDGTEGVISGLIATNATATNATSTNFYTDIFRAATGVITTLTGTNLSFTNATTTNLAITGLTQGSVPFIGAGGVVEEDNDSFFFDNANNRLGIGTSTPSSRLTIDTTSDNDGITFASSGTLVGTIAKGITNGASVGLAIDSAVTGRVLGIGGLVASDVALAGAGGNVGIGTTTPDYLLDVDGDFRVGEEGNSNALFVDATNGYVGINNANPDKLLSVANDLGAVIEIRSTHNGSDFVPNTDEFGAIEWYSEDTSQAGVKSAIRSVARLANGRSSALTFSTSNSSTNDIERLRIDENGNVGIGTTSPYAKLSVVGEAVAEYFTATSTTIASTFPLANFTSATSTNFYTTNFGINSEYISDLTGNALEISGGKLNVATTSLASGFYQQNGNSFGETAVLGTNDANDLRFETNGTTRLTVTAAGDVGIGTTTPTIPLQVASDDADKLFLTGSSNPLDQLRLGFNHTQDYAYIRALESGVAVRPIALNETGGNVGIGTTSPATTLHVYANAANANQGLTLQNASTAASADIYTRWIVGDETQAYTFGIDNSDNDTLKLTDGASPSSGNLLLAVDSSGNVGIGTSSPTGKLEVDGNIYLSDGLTDGIYKWGTGDLFIGNTNSGTIRVGGDSSDSVISPNNNRLVLRTLRDVDDILFEGNSVELARFDSGTGYFGIGTTTPTAQLAVTGSAGADAFVVANNADESLFVVENDGTVAFGIAQPNATYYQFAAPDNTQAVVFSDTSGNYRHVFGTDASSNPYWRSFNNKTLSLGVNSDDALYVTYNASGSQPDVGIGTTSPWGAFAVDASGTGTGENIAVFASSTTIGLLIDSLGNVGIGTDAPEGALHVVDSGSAATPNGNADNIVIEHTGNSGLSILSGSSNEGNIYFGDTDSDLQGAVKYSHLDDLLSLYSGGGRRLAITSTGNVGIATTTAQSRLTVSGGGAAVQIADNSGSGDSALTYLQFADENGVETGYVGDASTLDQSITISANDAVRIRAGGAERVTFSADGYLGIASTSPMLPLSIAGATTINNLTTNIALAGGAQGIQFLENGALEAGAITGFDGSINFWATDDITGGWNSTERAAIITNTREFGIATATPWGQLSVEGQGSKPSFVVADSSNNTDFIVTEDGSVGVGTTAPTANLEVWETSGAAENATFSAYSQDGRVLSLLQPAVGDGNDPWTWRTNNAFTWRVDSIDALNIESSGEVGVGTTSPRAALDVDYSGTGTGFSLSRSDVAKKATFDWVAADFNIGISGGSDYTFSEGGVEHVRITEAGNVGIATATPWGQLSVEGQGSKPSFVVSDTSNNSDFVVSSAGDVGVNTATPGNRLSIALPDEDDGISLTRSGWGTASGIFLDDDDFGENGLVIMGPSARDVSVGVAGNDTTDGFNVYTDPDNTGGADTFAFGVFNNGNVGIGSDAPAATLQVGTNTNFDTTDYDVIIAGGANSGTPKTLLQLLRPRNSGVAFEGGVGFNVSSYNPAVTNDMVTQLDITLKDTSSDDLSTIAPVLSLQSGGNVGIGTSTPLSRLNVTAGQEHAVTIVGNGLASTSPYTLSVQNNGGDNSTWIEVLNGVGGQGAFFGLADTDGDGPGDNDDFQVWNYQGGEIQFFTDPTPATYSGAPRMVIDEDGNVGIGESGPSSILHITANDPTITLEDSAGSPTGTWSLRNTDDSFRIRDVTTGADRFTVTANGGVGIGTTTVLGDTGQLLSVGNLKGSLASSGYKAGFQNVGIKDYLYSYGPICIQNASSACTGASGVVLGVVNTSALVNIPYGSNQDVFFNTGGDVGIGTAAPNSLLHVDGTFQAGTDTDNGIYFDDSRFLIGTTTGSGQLTLAAADATEDAFVFVRNDNNQQWAFNLGGNDFNIKDKSGGITPFVIENGTGRVGINDTSPDYRLELSQATSQGYFGVTSSTDGDIFKIDNSGNVGIGATAALSSKLTVNNASDGSNAFNFTVGGNTRLVIASASSGSHALVYSGNSVDLRLGVNSSPDDLVIKNGGNIGLSTTTPDVRLSIAHSGATADVFKISDNTGRPTFVVDSSGVTSVREYGLVKKSALFNIFGSALIESFNPNLTFYDQSAGGDDSWQLEVNGGALTFYSDVNNDDTYDDTLFVLQSNSHAKVGTSALADGNIFRLEDANGLCQLNPGSGSLATSCSSDERLKSDIVDAQESGLSYISDFRIRDYTVNADGSALTGVIAQEVLAVRPDMVTLGDNGFYLVEQPNVWKLVQALQELDIRTAGITTDVSGNVGIGTDTPGYKVHVLGDVAATSFVNISTREAKKGISYLDDARKADILETVKAVGVAEYRYEYESDSNPLRLGLIAEEAPAEILSVSGKGVDIYKLATFTLAAVQQLALDVESLEDRVAVLEAQIAAGGSGEGGVFSTSTLQAVLSDLGVLIERGFAQFDKLAFRELVATQSDAGAAAAGSVTILEGNKVAEVENSQVLASSKVFVTFTSPLEGNWFIADKQNGSFRVELDRSQNTDVSFDYFIVQTERSRTVDTSGTEEGGAPSHPGGAEPVITIIGDNPMTVIYDSEFVDPGAYVTDDKDTDITYDVYINGLREQVNRFNTRDVGEHEVMYHAIDKDGNVVSAVRTVYVVREGEEAPVSETPAEDPVVEEDPVEESDPVVEETPAEEPTADTVAPVVKLNGKAAVQVEVGATFTDAGATAIDDVDGDLTADIVVSGSVDTGAVGVYTLTYTVSDAAGNESSVSRTVTVVEPAVEEVPAEEPAPESTEAPVEDVVE